jgi:hypothetical protein
MVKYIHEEEGPLNNSYIHQSPSLVVVLVAEGGALGVENVPDLNIRPEAVDVDVGVEGQGVALRVRSTDGGGADSGVRVLPDAEVAVDESVVQPEGWVSGRTVDILHDGADTVVAPGVGTTFSTGSHVGVGVTRVASVNHVVAGVDGLGVVVVTGKAMALVAGSGADVDSQVGELLEHVSLALMERKLLYLHHPSHTGHRC